MAKSSLVVVLVLAVSLVLSGCVMQDWVGPKRGSAKVLEKAVEVSRGEAALAELRSLGSQAGLAVGEVKGICQFDADRNDMLSDREMLDIIAAWIRGELTDEEVLAAIALWIAGTSLGCYPEGPGYEGQFDRIAARDAAIRYIHETDPDSGIPLDPDWWEEDITPPGLVGARTFRYLYPWDRAWHILVQYPIVPEPVYHVEVTNYATGRYWELKVFSDGKVTPIPPSFGGAEFDRIAARDAAIHYIHETEPQTVMPGPEAGWNEEDISGGSVGLAIFRYTWPGGTGYIGGAYRAWRIWVRYPVVPNPDYRVEVMNLATGNYWGFTVLSTGQVVPSPLTFEGTVTVHARHSRSESWGIVVTRVPSEYEEYGRYLGKQIGLKAWAVMKPDLEGHEGNTITVGLSKLCLPFAEGCCQCVGDGGSGFDFCAPFVELAIR